MPKPCSPNQSAATKPTITAKIKPLIIPTNISFPNTRNALDWFNSLVARALATRELNQSNALRVFGKEILVGIINGLIFAVIVGLVAALWFGEHGLGIVIALAMLFNLFVAGFFGAAIPLLLQRWKIDPALGASILLTTVTDVVGFFVFLGLAQMLLI